MQFLLLLAATVSASACAPAIQEHEAIRFYQQGKLDSAIATIQKVVQACPERAFYRFMLGNALYRANRIEEARASYQQAVELDPSPVEWHISLGFTLFELGNSKAATEQWVDAIRRDPHSAFARAGAALGLYVQGDRANAIIEYDEAVKLEARYANPDGLAVDIRWKPRARALWSELQSLAGNNY